MQVKQKRLTKKSIKKSFLNSKKKHLLITGSKGSGKSTLLNELINDFDIVGINSYAVKEDGVYLKKDDKTIQIGKFNRSIETTDRRMQALSDGFKIAQIFIEELINSNSEFVYIDEIGYLENDQSDYQNNLINLFDKKRVIAVIRKQDSSFINELKNRDDVYIVDIDMPFDNVGLVIMASGFSKRFVDNKLLYKLEEKTLIETVIEKTKDYFKNIVVVTRYKEVKDICDRLDCDVIVHDYLYKNDTIRLGLNYLKDKVDSCMFMTSDQPELLEDTISGMIIYYNNNPSNIIRLSYKDNVGNPVIFPKYYFNELLNLPIGKGGNIIIRNNPDKVKCYEAFNELELFDIDSKEDIEKLRKRKEA